MKLSRKFIIIFVTIVVICLFVFFKVRMDRKNPILKNNKSVEGPSLVMATIIKPVILNNTIKMTGNILANNQVELHSEVSGKVIRLYFEEGSHVNKNEILAKINDADLQAQMRKQEYQQKQFEDKVARQKVLLESNSISKEEFDNTFTSLNIIKSDIELIRAQIDKTEIRAPFSGIIGLRNIDEGSYISPVTVIAEIIEPDPVKIDFSIPEKYANSVRKNDTLNFTVQNARKKFTARIYAIEPGIDPSTRTLNIRAFCPNKQGEIIPGSFAEIELILNRKAFSFMVPNEAIIPVLKGKILYLYKNGTVKQVDVITGIRTDVKSEILEGLNEGDTLITTGIMKLKPGSPVKIIKIIP
jgi:membrane fusion protein, multidrug efflux system